MEQMIINVTANSLYIGTRITDATIYSRINGQSKYHGVT